VCSSDLSLRHISYKPIQKRQSVSLAALLLVWWGEYHTRRREDEGKQKHDPVPLSGPGPYPVQVKRYSDQEWVLPTALLAATHIEIRLDVALAQFFQHTHHDPRDEQLHADQD
jgi:hypothetical protein